MDGLRGIYIVRVRVQELNGTRQHKMHYLHYFAFLRVRLTFVSVSGIRVHEHSSAVPVTSLKIAFCGLRGERVRHRGTG